MDGPEADGASIWDAAHRRTTIGLLTLVTLVAFEAMAVGTAMPRAVAELDGVAWYAWTFSAFLVTSVVGMVVGGEVGDRRPPGPGVLAGVLVFAAGLVVAGVAQHMAVLVLGRAVQGLGAGVVIVLLYVVAGRSYSSRLRPRLFGAFAAGWVLPALVGPLAAGLVTTHVGWRAVFLGLVPLVAAGLALLLTAGPGRAPGGEAAPRGRGRAAWAVLAGTGIAALQYAAQRLDLAAVVIALAGAAGLAVALRRLLPSGTVRARAGIPAVVASRGLLAGAFFGMDALLPFVLTEQHGWSAATAGLPLTAGAVGWVVAAQLQGRRPDVPRQRVLRLGCLVLAAGLAATAATAVPALGGWPAYLSWAVAGVGMGLGMPSVGVLLLDQSPEAERGANSAALQISDVTASALCVGLAGVLVAGAAEGRGPLWPAVLAAVAGLTVPALLGARVAGRTVAPARASGSVVRD
ncbi:Predicted arabinose efflux permease, MFS family [Geodermatophilus obscurus]|uniref:Predicted arabinose efflux permease, MFS family n=1 Tax=Geodermatophilus obscurus TaxID=1861 RepID=A0A1I5GPX6_9ACTN|nr:MFS transporter [Geodermatophilus obscurus]SFO37969.1 Predicted arabinose efflux permease, MFS family [Geodermatophilus obscurus]